MSNSNPIIDVISQTIRDEKVQKQIENRTENDSKNENKNEHEQNEQENITENFNHNIGGIILPGTNIMMPNMTPMSAYRKNKSQSKLQSNNTNRYVYIYITYIVHYIANKLNTRSTMLTEFSKYLLFSSSLKN